MRFFCKNKGYGFIRDLQTGEDVFVHYSMLQRSSRGWRGLFRGEYVWFLDEAGERGRAATHVCGVREGPLMCDSDYTSWEDFGNVTPLV